MGQLELSAALPPIYFGAGVAKGEADILRLVGTEAAAMVIGSFTEPEWAGNDEGGNKRVEYWHPKTRAYYNSIGLTNLGRVRASEYLPLCIRRAQDRGQAAIISVTTLKEEDPHRVLPDLAYWALEMGANGVEINGSCPNIDPNHPLLCNDVDATYGVINSIRKQVGPESYLIYKVSALTAAVIKRYRSEGQLKVSAVSAINTVGNQPSPINPATGRPFIEVNNGLAGKSGPSILHLARAQLKMWLGMNDEPALHGRKFDILSIGGVDNGREVYLRQRMGALIVGGTQEPRRANDPGEVVRRWAEEYAAAEEAYS